jgi:hypothetical protein
VSDSSDAGERTVLPMYSGSEASIKAFALVVFFALVGYVHRTIGERSAAILSLSPAFIFSVGRGYEEVYFALAFAVAFGLFTGLWSSNMRLLQNLVGGCMLMLIPYSKGMSWAILCASLWRLAWCDWLCLACTTGTRIVTVYMDAKSIQGFMCNCRRRWNSHASCWNF